MKRQTRLRLVLLAVACLLGAGVVELGVRLLLQRTVDGQLHFRRAPIRPYVLPLEHTRRMIAAYEQRQERAGLVHDPDLGWTLAAGRGGINGVGARAGVEHSHLTPPGVLRIALVGDSFTHGDEVSREQTWAHALQEELRAEGLAVEVLNFGVPAFAIDQAYLRWRDRRQVVRPDVVVHGFVYEDVYRNLNVFRTLYVTSSELPFTKPRFVLSDGGLELVNHPVMPLDAIVPTLEAFPDHPLAQHETYYQPSHYLARPWWRARSIGLAVAGLRRLDVGPRGVRLDDEVHSVPTSFHDLDGEAAQLTLAIWQRWSQEVAGDDALFVLLHLPRDKDLERFRTTGRMVYEPLHAAAGERFVMVETREVLAEATATRLFMPHRHYTPAANRLVAQQLADRLLDLAPRWARPSAEPSPGAPPDGAPAAAPAPRVGPETPP